MFWMPVAQDGRCSFACVWEWLQMTLLEGLKVCNSLNDFIRLACQGTLKVLDARPEGHDTRSNAVGVRRFISQVEQSPEKLVELWHKLDTQYIWRGLVDVLLTVQIRLWEYQENKSLRCTLLFPEERGSSEMCWTYFTGMIEWPLTLTTCCWARIRRLC